MKRQHSFAPPLRRQAGLTLVELMVSIAIGMLMVAGLAVLIASQSSSRSDLDRAGKMIENGRYSVQVLTTDAQMAGYWGELSTTPSAPGSLPNPCDTSITSLQGAMGLHVQGYSSLSALTTDLSGCLSNFKSGTDILVVRHAEPDTSALLTGANIDLSKLVDGVTYVQTGLDSATLTNLSSVVALGNTASNATTFNLVKRDSTPANTRKMLVHIYYVASCSVCSPSSDGVPTLKRWELGATPTTITLAEGVENFQVDYGKDSDSDGAPDGDYVDGSAFSVADWSNVMSLRVHVLARSLDKSNEFTDAKKYKMGTAGEITPATADKQYRRHLFVQTVKLVNPSVRRQG
jgi:type IV pilus assembly protein PilW